MPRVLHTRPGVDEERREHIRYEYLERIYLLAGEDCSRGVSGPEIEEQFGALGTNSMMLARELAHLGLVRFTDEPFRVCMTGAGVEYVQRRAWRRRTVRTTSIAADLPDVEGSAAGGVRDPEPG